MAVFSYMMVGGVINGINTKLQMSRVQKSVLCYVMKSCDSGRTQLQLREYYFE